LVPFGKSSESSQEVFEYKGRRLGILENPSSETGIYYALGARLHPKLSARYYGL